MVMFEDEEVEMESRKCRVTKVSRSFEVLNRRVDAIDNTSTLTEHVRVFHPQLSPTQINGFFDQYKHLICCNGINFIMWEG